MTARVLVDSNVLRVAGIPREAAFLAARFDAETLDDQLPRLFGGVRNSWRVDKRMRGESPYRAGV